MNEPRKFDWDGVTFTLTLFFIIGTTLVVMSWLDRPSSISKPLGTTNEMDNGLGVWLVDTNHSFGPTVAKRIYVLRYPDGRYYIRFDSDTGLIPLFVNDKSYSSLENAQRALTINTDLQENKAFSDAVEDAFRGLPKKD